MTSVCSLLTGRVVGLRGGELDGEPLGGTRQRLEQQEQCVPQPCVMRETTVVGRCVVRPQTGLRR